MSAQSLLQNSNPLNFLPKKPQLFLPIILLFNSQKISFPAFYYFSIILQHIPLLILSTDFQKQSISIQLSKILRYCTSYKFNQLISNRKFYIIVNIIFILVEFFYFFYFLKKHYELYTPQKNKFFKPKPKVNLLITLIYYFNVIFISQLTEFLSLIVYDVIFKDSFIYISSTAKTIQYILLCCNILLIVMLNLNFILFYLATNFPFHTVDANVHTLKTKLSNNKIVCEIILNNLGMIHFIEFCVSESTRTIIKIVIGCLICGLILIISITELIYFNFEEYFNYTSRFIYAFSCVSIILEIIMLISKTQITKNKTMIFLLLCKMCVSVALVNNFSSLKRKLFISKLNKILFRIYEDAFSNYRELYDCFYFLFSYIYIKDHSKVSFVSNFLLDHEQKCKNEICKCKLIDLLPINSLSFNNIDFCKHLISRIGFYIETCIIKINYSNDYYLTILLAEYYYLIKLNPIMSFSIIDTFFNANNKKVSLTQNVHLCMLINRYALTCSNKIHYDNMCELYQSLLYDKIITKIMKEYVNVFEKQVNNKENFENGIKLAYYIDSTDVRQIHSKFLTPSNIEMITDLLIQKDNLFYLLIKSISSYIQNLSDSIPIEFYMKCILFYYLFNTGKIPNKILIKKQKDSCDSLNYSQKSKTLRSYQNSINFFCEVTICDEIETILNKHYDKISTSYNMIIKCVNGFKIQYISGELNSKIGYHHKYKKYINLVGEDLSILLPKSISALHHQAMINYIIANKNFSFVGKKYLFTQEMQMLPCTLTVCSMPGIFDKHLGILCNVLLNQSKKNDLVILQNHLNETIALSNSFYTKYEFNLDLIEKFGINLLELFEINAYYIQKTFNKDIKRISKIKRLFRISTDNTFCMKLFHNKTSESDITAVNGCGLFENMGKNQKIKSEDLLSIRNEIEMMYSYYNNTSNKGKRNSLFKDKKMMIKKKKVKVLSNILKLLVKLSEMELFNQYSKQLAQAILKIKNQLNNNGYTCKFTSMQSFNCPAINNFPKKAETNVFNSTLRNKQQIQHFDIKIILKCLYGIPLFLIKIKDKDLFGIRILNYQNDMEAEHYLDGNKYVQKKVSYKYYSSKLEHTKIKKNYKKKVKNSQKESTSLSLLYFLSKTTTDKEFKKELILFTSLFSALFISIIITFILFYLQDTVLNKSHTLYQCLFLNSYQRDNVLNIYDSALSILFQIEEITNCTEHNLHLNDYFDSLHKEIISYENNYHEFYSIYQETKDRDLNFNTNYSFSKIHINWYEANYEGDYLGEVYTLIYYCKEVLREKHKLEEIEKDINMVIYDHYKQKVETSIKTNYGKTLFYILKNYYTVYRIIFNDFETQIIEAFGEYFKLAVLRIVSVEILGLIGFIAFYLLILIFLNLSNNNLFETIMKMFLEGSDLNMEHIAIKNHGENVFLKHKLKDVLELLNSFQISNLRKFKNMKYDPNKSSTLYYDGLSSTNIQNNLVQTKSISNMQLFHQPTHSDNSTYINSKFSTNTILRVPRATMITNAGNANTMMGEGIASNDNLSSNKNHQNSFLLKSQSRKRTKINVDNTKNNNNPSLSTSNITTNSKLYNTKMNLINTTNSNIQSPFSSVEGNDFSDPNQKLSLEQIISITHNEGFPLIKILSFLVILFFIFILVLIIFKIYFSLSYLTDNKDIFNEFIILTSKYSNLYYYFNSLRKMLISPPSETTIHYFEDVTTQVKTNWANSKVIDIKKFPKIYELSLLVNSKNIDEKNLTNNFFDKGLNTASEAIMQYIASVFSDYLSESDPIDSTEKVKTLLINNKNAYSMTLIEISFSFVYQDLQTKIYDAFKEDSSNIKEHFQEKIDIFNICCIIYCIPVIFFVIYGVVLSINTKFRIAKRSSKKFIKTLKHLLNDYKKKTSLDFGNNETNIKEQTTIGYNASSLLDSSLFIQK